jgi:hypothetical protein
MKSKASLGWLKLSIPEKVEKGNHIISSIESNPVFKNCIPTTTEVATLLAELETAHQNSMKGGLNLTVLLHQKEKEVDNAMSRLVNFVEIVANGDDAVILAAGMGVKARAIPQQRTVAALHGEHQGEAILQAPAVKNGSYLWQKKLIRMAADETSDAWEHAGVTTRTRFVVQGLTAGAKYLFRVASITSKGQGPWSDAVSLIAL